MVKDQTWCRVRQRVGAAMNYFFEVPTGRDHAVLSFDLLLTVFQPVFKCFGNFAMRCLCHVWRARV